MDNRDGWRQKEWESREPELSTRLDDDNDDDDDDDSNLTLKAILIRKIFKVLNAPKRRTISLYISRIK